ncbi:hypothetical protein ACVIIW_005403 [Bradyrhizobium sp. USDA 4449]
MFAKSSKAHPGGLRNPVFGVVGGDFQQLLDTPASDGSDDPELGKMGAD